MVGDRRRIRGTIHHPTIHCISVEVKAPMYSTCIGRFYSPCGGDGISDMNWCRGDGGWKGASASPQLGVSLRATNVLTLYLTVPVCARAGRVATNKAVMAKRPGRRGRTKRRCIIYLAAGQRRTAPSPHRGYRSPASAWPANARDLIRCRRRPRHIVDHSPNR